MYELNTDTDAPENNGKKATKTIIGEKHIEIKPIQGNKKATVSRKNTATKPEATATTKLMAAKANKSKATPKMSDKALATHRKWQEAAHKMGGPTARIVVSKPKAKQLIFDVLHDSFCPMNVTELHKASIEIQF